MTMMAGALIVIDTETLAEVDAVEELAHVVEGVDGDAEPADFAERARVVAVEAHQRRQVERGAQAGLAFVEEELEALVGLPGGAEAGELPHRPQPAAIHATRGRRVKRDIGPDSRDRVWDRSREIVGRVKRLDGHAADGGRRLLARRGGGDFGLPAFTRG